MAKVDKNAGSEPGDALDCAQTLRSLGWSNTEIDKILAGPEKSSIHDIAGRLVEARPVDTLQTAVEPEEKVSSAALASTSNTPQTDLGIGQKQIADAVWASVSAGNPIPLAAIARQLKKLPGPLQAYVMAASLEVKQYYNDLVAWKRDFDRAQSAGAAQRGKDGKSGTAVAGAAVGVVSAVAVAAAAANAVPVVGQVVSAILALGLAVATAIVEANPLPVRKAEDQVRPGYEGVRVFRGLAVDPPAGPYDDPYRILKQAVVQDSVAFSLPAVPPRTPFDFAPRLAAFQEAAHQLSLYAEDGTQT